MASLVLAAAVAAAADYKSKDTYRFELALDETEHKLSGRLHLQYLNDSESPLSELRLRLDINLSFPDSMEIISIRDPANRGLEWNYLPLRLGKMATERGAVAVKLPRPLPAGDTAGLEIEFSISGNRFLGSALTLLQDDPYFSLDAWYPKAMSFRDGCWRNDDDRPSDYDVLIDLPRELAFASTGKVVEERDLGGGRKAVRLAAGGRRGFTIYGSAQWQVKRGRVGDIDLAVYHYGLSAQRAPMLLEAAADAIAYYSERFGPFPCDHLDIACPLIGHGGSAACDVIIIFMGGSFDEQYRWLAAHEVAHQYFGNLVCQPRDEVHWVTVGLGLIMDRNYMLARGLDSGLSDDLVRFYHIARRLGYDTTLAQPLTSILADRSDWAWQWNMGIGHGKAIAVCRMLMDLIGEEEFYGLIAGIIREKAGGILTTAEFLKLCEETYGGSLDWFAADWVYGDALLDYAVGVPEKTDGGWIVPLLRLGTASYPVTVEVVTTAGGRLRLRTDRTLEGGRLNIKSTREPASVVVDPDQVCPDIDRANNAWPPAPPPGG